MNQYTKKACEGIDNVLEQALFSLNTELQAATTEKDQEVAIERCKTTILSYRKQIQRSIVIKDKQSLQPAKHAIEHAQPAYTREKAEQDWGNEADKSFINTLPENRKAFVIGMCAGAARFAHKVLQAMNDKPKLFSDEKPKSAPEPATDDADAFFELVNNDIHNEGDDNITGDPESAI